MGREQEPARQTEWEQPVSREQVKAQGCGHQKESSKLRHEAVATTSALAFQTIVKSQMRFVSNDVLGEYAPKYKTAPNRSPSGSQVDQAPSPVV